MSILKKYIGRVVKTSGICFPLRQHLGKLEALLTPKTAAKNQN